MKTGLARKPEKLNKFMCQALHMGWNNPTQQHSARADKLESHSEEKNLGVLVDSKLKKKSQ